MRWPAFPLLMTLWLPAATFAQDLVPPEIVRLEKTRIEGYQKIVEMGNGSSHYALYCKIQMPGCITPEPNINYLLFDKNTRWRMPRAKDLITLQFVQDWTAKYDKGENIGLVAEPGNNTKDSLGIFLLAQHERRGGAR